MLSFNFIHLSDTEECYSEGEIHGDDNAHTGNGNHNERSVNRNKNNITSHHLEEIRYHHRFPIHNS